LFVKGNAILNDFSSRLEISFGMVIIGGNSWAKRLCMSNCLFFKPMLKIWGRNGKVADNFWPAQDQECNLHRKILLTPQRKGIIRIFLFPIRPCKLSWCIRTFLWMEKTIKTFSSIAK